MQIIRFNGKAFIGHYIGNILQSVCGLIDNLIGVLSLGLLSSTISLNFIRFRLRAKFLHSHTYNKLKNENTIR